MLLFIVFLEDSNGIHVKLAAVDHQMHSSINQSTSNGSQNSTDSPTRFTQSSVSDVAWDWHSPRTNQNNKNHKKLGEFLHTPKGSRSTRKKRNLNSPPIFKPNKRKLLKMDNAAKPTSLEEELQALSNQLKPDDEQSHEFTESSDIDDFDNGIESNPNKSSADKMTIGHNEITTNINGFQSKLCTKKSLECLFDDSIDDCMIRCSQEIEEKLKFEVKQVKTSRDRQLSLKSTSFYGVTSKCVTPQVFPRSKSIQIETKHSTLASSLKPHPIASVEGSQQSISFGSESTPKISSKTSMLCHANLERTLDVKQTNIQSKSKNSILFKSNNLRSSTTTSKEKNSISTVDGLDAYNIPDDFFNESQDFTELPSEKNQRATEKPEKRKSCSNKFFKNSSDSNFDGSSGSKVSSAVETMSTISNMKRASGSSSKIFRQGQSVSNESLALSHDKKKMNNGILLNNEKISNSDRLKVNEDGSSKQSPVTQYTQEEIKSKHREAKMKLEAKEKCIKVRVYSNQQKVI